MSWQFLVNRSDLASTRLHSGPPTDGIALAQDESLLAVERFSLTANNVTYAAFGDQLGYWNAYPASAEVDGAAWGIVPAWGFATVVRSADPAIAPGTRLYGFVPMASHFVARFEQRGTSLIDRNPHRAGLAAVYNSFTLAGEPGPMDDLRSLLQPLLVTSWLIDLHLADIGMMGAQRIILSSASSKTALGLAWLLKQRGGVEVIGLTSARNIEAMHGTGCYDSLISYDDVDGLVSASGASGNASAIYVDFAGNRALNARVHGMLADGLLSSIVVGGTHHDARGTGEALPGVQPQFFFAPEHARQRIEAWGESEFAKNYAGVVRNFATANRWLRLEHFAGPDGLAAAWHLAMDGKAAPTSGMIVNP